MSVLFYKSFVEGDGWGGSLAPGAANCLLFPPQPGNWDLPLLYHPAQDLPLLYHPTWELELQCTIPPKPGTGMGRSTTTVYYTTHVDSKYDFEL